MRISGSESNGPSDSMPSTAFLDCLTGFDIYNKSCLAGNILPVSEVKVYPLFNIFVYATKGIARETGASEQEISRAVTIGLSTKRRAHDEMLKEAKKYTDVDVPGIATNELTATTKTEWLMATAAALAANATIGFEIYSAAAEDQGATANEVKMVQAISCAWCRTEKPLKIWPRKCL